MTTVQYCIYVYVKQGAQSVKLIDLDIIERCEQCMGSKTQFTECTRQVKDYLADGPFRSFEQSMYFHRYLQWKWLERFVDLLSIKLIVGII